MAEDQQFQPGLQRQLLDYMRPGSEVRYFIIVEARATVSNVAKTIFTAGQQHKFSFVLELVLEKFLSFQVQQRLQ